LFASFVRTVISSASVPAALLLLCSARLLARGAGMAVQLRQHGLRRQYFPRSLSFTAAVPYTAPASMTARSAVAAGSTQADSMRPIS